jgi:quercetin 2,3-dioxygenase
MMTLRPSAARGTADHGWLQSRHSFSFAEYHDPAHMGVGNLRVINEDRIAPGGGFGTHGHRDMEIISVVMQGSLAHRDSMGNTAIIRPGEVQRMSAGRGVMHSEFNHEAAHSTHFFQIWLLPNAVGVEPSYAQQTFDDAARDGRLCLVASPDGAQGSLSMHADARLYLSRLSGSQTAKLTLQPKRRAYVHVARGSLHVNGQRLNEGDAATLQDEPALVMDGAQQADVMVFDLA